MTLLLWVKSLFCIKKINKCSTFSKIGALDRDAPGVGQEASISAEYVGGGDILCKVTAVWLG